MSAALLLADDPSGSISGLHNTRSTSPSSLQTPLILHLLACLWPLSLPESTPWAHKAALPTESIKMLAFYSPAVVQHALCHAGHTGFARTPSLSLPKTHLLLSESGKADQNLFLDSLKGSWNESIGHKSCPAERWTYCLPQEVHTWFPNCRVVLLSHSVPSCSLCRSTELVLQSKPRCSSPVLSGECPQAPLWNWEGQLVCQVCAVGLDLPNIQECRQHSAAVPELQVSTLSSPRLIRK